MTKTPDPIQELVTAARRKQILDAATQVFAEKGFHRATIKDIARVAGIADGTIYTYFASKTEVLLGILHRLNESTEREQQLMPESGQDLRSFFAAYLRQRMALLWPNRCWCPPSPSPNTPFRHRAQQGRYGASMCLSRFVPSRACF
jgi:AcrR family transcriptional regulator